MKTNKKLNENAEDLIFVFNTKELHEDGFTGSFSDFINEIKDKGGITTTTFDDEGNLIVIIFKICTEDIEKILSDFSVEHPSEFTQECDDEDTENIIDDNIINNQLFKDIKPEDADDKTEDIVDVPIDGDDENDDENDEDDDENDEDDDENDEDEDTEIKYNDKSSDDDNIDIINFDNNDEISHDEPDDDLHIVTQDLIAPDKDKDDDDLSNIVIDDGSDEDFISIEDPDDDGSDDDDDDDDDDNNADDDVFYPDDPNKEEDFSSSINEYPDDDYELEAKTDYIPKGTKNLSENNIHNIVNQVKEYSLLNRINEKFFSKFDFLKVQKKIASDKKLYEDHQACIERTKKYGDIIKNTPFPKIKIDGKKLYEYNSSEINKILSNVKKNYIKYKKIYTKLDESLFAKDKHNLKNQLLKQKKLIKILELQSSALNKMKKPLNEDEDNPENKINDNPNDEATLTSIIFKVKNADDFIKVLTDNGIPAEALEKVDNSPVDNSTNNNQDQSDNQNNQAPAQNEPAPEGGMTPAPQQPATGNNPGANPFEGKKELFINKLYEDDNPFEGSIDSQNDNDVTDTEDDTEGEEVKLKDTNYAKKIEEILAKVYNYPESEFVDKIGGDIIDDNNDEINDGSDDGSDESQQHLSNVGDDSASNKDNGDDGTEEEINPEDVFGDI